MAINIFTVQTDAEEQGWKLLSDSYKNLKTPLEWECPKGHKIQDTYENWRKKHECKECLKIQSNGVARNQYPSKKEGDFRVLALDAATETSGYAIFDNKKLVAYGTYSPIYTSDATARINAMKHWVDKICREIKPDAIGIEGIQYQKQHGVKTFQTLANLQGVLLDFFYEHRDEYEHDVVGSSTWRSYLGLNHAEARETAKQRAQNYVKLLFHINPTQDEADAICLGYYCVNHFKPTKNTKIIWGEDIL